MSFYREQLEEYLSELEVEADYVIDWGGEQNPVEDRVKKWKVTKYLILDKEHDLNKWQGIKNQADLIFCLETLEYCYDIYGAFENIHAALKLYGRAIISVPLVYPHHEEANLDSIRLTETGINRLAKAVGLRVDKVVYRVDKSGKLVEFYKADGMKMARSIPDHTITGYICELSKNE